MSAPRTATAHSDLTVEQWRSAVTLVDWDRALILAKGHCKRDHDHKASICGDSMDAILKWDYDDPKESLECWRCIRGNETYHVEPMEFAEEVIEDVMGPK